ncbi:hypothetical protein EON63_00655 [archaeon]|nr:MAG: hypothetical protein EON63_00655 [archaeon]
MRGGSSSLKRYFWIWFGDVWCMVYGLQVYVWVYIWNGLCWYGERLHPHIHNSTCAITHIYTHIHTHKHTHTQLNSKWRSFGTYTSRNSALSNPN